LTFTKQETGENNKKNKIFLGQGTFFNWASSSSLCFSNAEISVVKSYMRHIRKHDLFVTPRDYNKSELICASIL
jgi:hypothetical protein